MGKIIQVKIMQRIVYFPAEEPLGCVFVRATFPISDGGVVCIFV